MLPPIPKKIPKILEAHGDQRSDDYYWLRDDSRSDQEIIKYLEEENKYSENWFVEGKDYRKELYEELLNFIPEEETSLKIKKKIVSHLKIDVPTFKSNKLPKYLKLIPVTTPGSRFIK